VITALGRRHEAVADDRLERDRASAEAAQGLLEASLGKLAQVGRAERLTQAMIAEGGDLSDVVGMIHRALGMPAPRLDRPAGPSLADVEAVLSRSTGARSRPVLLKETWWTSTGGPLLGFLQDRVGAQSAEPETDVRPVALLPARGGYRLFDPQRPRRGGQPIDAALAEGLHPQAHQFYRSLPEGLGGLGLLRFLARGAGGDLLLVAFVGTLLGLLGLLVRPC
jgi:hypothetical protein